MKTILLAVYSKLKIPFFIVALLVGLYCLIGFLLVPYLLEHPVMTALSEKTGHRFSLANADFNPFEMSLRLEGFGIEDPEGASLLQMDSVATDFEVSSVFEDAYTLEALRVEGPRVNLRRLKDGRLNIAALVPPAEEAEEPADKEAFPFLIKQLSLSGGEIQFEDKSLKQPFDVHLAEITFGIERLSTLPAEGAAYTLSVKSDLAREMTVIGLLSLAPLSTAGEIDVKGLQLTKLSPYLDGLSDYRVRSGTLDTDAQFRFDASQEQIVFHVLETMVQLGNVKAASIDSSAPAVDVGALRLRDLDFQLGPRKLTLGAIEGNAIKTSLAGAEGPVIDVNSVALKNLDFDLKAQKLHLASASTKQAILKPSAEQPPLIQIPALEIGNIATDLAGRQVSIGKLASGEAAIEGWLNEDGTVNYTTLFPREPAAPSEEGVIAEAEEKEETGPAAEPETQAPPWFIQLGELSLKNYRVSFQDRTLPETAYLSLAPLNLTLREFSSRPGSKFKIDVDGTVNEKGQVSVSGTAGLSPVSGEFNVEAEGVDLTDFQPYVDPYLLAQLRKGRLNVSGRINVGISDGKTELAWRGDASVTDFAATKGTRKSPFLKWQRLAFNNISFDLDPMRLEIDEIVSDKHFANVVIEPGGTTNLAELIKERPGVRLAEAATEPKKTAPMPIRIGAIRFVDGSAQFADRSLEPHFSTSIHEINGAVKDLSSVSKTDARVYLEGKVDKYAPVTIQGHINPFAAAASSEIDMSFKNLSLTTLTPYSGKFAGYTIEKGKMSMDLKYTIRERVLRADSNIVLDQLTLGEKVESPQATSLPVALAIALMKDPNGQIDLDLPIQGSLDDPKFSVGALVGKALLNVLKKVVSAPFALLGKLVGSKEQLNQVEFAPGQFELDEAARGKLQQVAKALKSRPELQLEVRGIADRKADRDGLAENKLRVEIQLAKYKKMDRDTRPAKIREVEITDEEYWQLLPEVYQRTLGALPEPLDLQAAEEKLIQTLSVEEVELRILAQARSRAIRDFLVEAMHMSERRIYLLDVKLKTEAKPQGPVASMLSLGA